MGLFWGHIVPGFSFFLMGLWHLFNHIKLHINHPKSYTALPWFPTSRFRYLELFLIIGGSVAFISFTLFISPAKHQPLDADGTIPSNHLRNFEHSNIYLTFLVYAIFSIILDKIQAPAQYGLTLTLEAIAFGQELLIFYFHSADHTEVEGQYHRLLQIVIFVSLLTTLLGIGYPKSFLISLIRSLSILFQGVWIMIIGIMIGTPEFMPKGCFLNLEDGRQVVRCHDHESLERAKSLVNISFGWYLVGVTVSAISFYLALMKMFLENVGYESLDKFDDQESEQEDVEAQKRNLVGQTEISSSLPAGTSFVSLGIEKVVGGVRRMETATFD